MQQTHSFAAVLVLFVTLTLVGCSDDLVGSTAEDEALLATQTTAASAQSANSDRAAQRGPMIWANGELFRSIVTTATFDGDQGNFDALYVLSDSYTFDGPYTHLSASAPGDQDYNGGRWEVFHLKNPGADAGKYDDVSSTDDSAFDPNDWESTHFYFECPMLPQRGRQ